jgi:hypothetical protein
MEPPPRRLASATCVEHMCATHSAGRSTQHALFMCVYAHTLYITAHLLAFPFPEANAAQQSLFLLLDAGHALEAAFWFRK